MIQFPLPIKTVIIDDDASSLEILSKGLEKHSDVVLAGTAANLTDGMELIRRASPDLVFLDIEFPGESAMTMLENSEGGGTIRIVLYSSYRKYLLRALRLKVFDFLLKPFDANELSLILNRFRMERVQVPAGMQSLSPVRMVAPVARNIAITTVTNDRLILQPSDILYFRYDSTRKLWEAVLNNLRHYILRRHTTAEMILQYSESFQRTHKAYIVNLQYVSLITAQGCTMLPPFDHIDEIKISKIYRRDLLDRFYDI